MELIKLTERFPNPSQLHVLLTPETCPCDKQSDISCNVCDGGLAVCSLCGKAEAELDRPCQSPGPRYSYSQISTYAACPTLYKFHYEDCLQFLGESEHDLRFGKAWDAAMNAWYAGAGMRAAMKAFSDGYPREEYPSPLPLWSQGKSYTGGLNGIGAYIEKYEQEDRNWEVISIQSRDTHETDDGDSRTVVLDLVVQDRRDGLIYGVDNKSTSKYLDSDFWLQFDPHSQIRQYADHLQRKHGPCGGFYVNAASFRHRSKAYTPRSGPDKGVQLPAGDWQDFKRMCFNPNANAIQMERANFTSWVRKIEGDRETGQWAYNTNYCKRGAIICPYHRICSAGYQWPQDRELIEAYYRPRCTRLAGNGERCWLEPGHGGEHDSTKPVIADPVVDLADDEVEEAEV